MSILNPSINVLLPTVRPSTFVGATSGSTSGGPSITTILLLGGLGYGAYWAYGKWQTGELGEMLDPEPEYPNGYSEDSPQMRRYEKAVNDRGVRQTVRFLERGRQMEGDLEEHGISRADVEARLKVDGYRLETVPGYGYEMLAARRVR